LPPAPTAPSGSGLRALSGQNPCGSQPLRARSLIAQASLLCFGPKSSAGQRPFLGCRLLTLTLRPVRYRHLFRRLSVASRIRGLRRARILVPLRMSSGFFALRFPLEPVPRARVEGLMHPRAAPAENEGQPLWITWISWTVSHPNRFREPSRALGPCLRPHESLWSEA